MTTAPGTIIKQGGNPFGSHRVIEPEGGLPQPARKLDNGMDVLYDNEILVDVDTLNIDSASFGSADITADGAVCELNLTFYDKPSTILGGSVAADGTVDDLRFTLAADPQTSTCASGFHSSPVAADGAIADEH